MERNENDVVGSPWHVTADGLEHASTGYFIERSVIGARRANGLWEWPLQLAEKTWCRPGPFAAAFRAALDRFAIPADADLEASLAVAFPDAPRARPEGFRALAEIVSTPAARASLRRPVAATARPAPARPSVPAGARRPHLAGAGA